MWRVVALGNLGPNSPHWPATQEYLRRIRRYTPLDLHEVKPQKGPNPAAILKKETQLLLPYLSAAQEVVVLDEQGRNFSSAAFAHWLQERTQLLFVVGSAWGMAPEIKDRAQHSLALSSFTLPHELARVVLLEQLYRALTIQAGHPYHHA
ncbi:23S rRNA (pseudouridine(1915)-N(3))-methyltransferase RlmH [Anthocerotibacter panamensis]|uniref:23S rRNA (pseudouridine(1915)-N(3))-methyltransferase RlmH n=1 Tax=Anthocerotibacter panamensis TaxID=2857077 RepID=UPI001C4047D7|nr:23S rRNA (pseudouridine(1915)-N(3))-methyltransferase RlmH [Anthocerotibacter panamensis]